MKFSFTTFLVFIILFSDCKQNSEKTEIQDSQLIDLKGYQAIDTSKIWLSHEHILVDFIGADSIKPKSWNHDSILKEMIPYVQALVKYELDYFVDATPNFLGRDVHLLEKISNATGINVMTNTGFYGARDSKFIPDFAKEMSEVQLAEIWIAEFEQGIEGTDVKPGFIKIGVDNTVPLKPLHEKLVKAAALTHLKTGLTIASHTGAAKAMWPQLALLQQLGVAPSAFIWVHAQQENDYEQYVKAAKAGCWISLDGLGWETEKHLDKLQFAKDKGFLDRILISHDAGWYDPQKEKQSIQPYTNIFENVIPELLNRGFTADDINLLIKYNPAKAFAIDVRSI